MSSSKLAGLLPPITRDIAFRNDPTGESAGSFTDYKPTMAPREQIYYDENMQPYDPKTRKDDGAPSIMKGPMNPAMVLDIVSKPSAIVVGSGLPGVHMAYELARKGFQVDVYEAQTTPGCGNTPFMNPVVGQVFEKPAVLERFSPYRTLGNALKFIPGCSDPWIKVESDPYKLKVKRAILRDFTTSFRSIQNSGGGGFWAGSNETERLSSIMSKGSSLSMQSAAKVRQMLKDHPKLREAVVTPLYFPDETTPSSGSTTTSPSQPSRSESSANRSIWSKITFGLIGGGRGKRGDELKDGRSSSEQEVKPSGGGAASSSTPRQSEPLRQSSPTEEGTTITIQPLNWTQTLAQICSEEYGVRFHFDAQITSASLESYGDTNLINGLYLMKKMSEEGGTKNAKNREEMASCAQTARADLYVFAAGVTNPIMLSYLVGFSPLIVTSGTASIFELKRKEGAPATESTNFVRALRAALLQQNADGFYFFPSQSPLRFSLSEIPFSRKYSEKSGMIVGGQTLAPEILPHTTKGGPMDVFSYVLDDLFSKVSSHVGSTPLMNSLSDVAAQYRASRKDPAAARDFHSYTYYKTSTADGLPVASRVGPYFNAFVIGGFGDNSPTLAPQAAAELTEMIAKPRDADARSPLPIERFAPNHRGLKADEGHRPLEERLAPSAGLSTFQKMERAFNRNVTQPFNRVAHEVLLRIVASPYMPAGLAYKLYLGHVTAEDEERLTGQTPTNIVKLNIPMITPETSLIPPDTPKEFDFKEGSVRVRDY